MNFCSFHKHLRWATPLLPTILTACIVFSTTPTTYDIALGDLDGDTNLDIFAGSFERGYAIWENDEKGNYD
jgi:hypothetical protein